MINITYPDYIKYILDKSKVTLIPKKVPDKQKYFKMYHKYYCKDFSIESYFKVIDIFDVEEDKYATLSFSDNIFWTIPNIIEDNSGLYELIYDKNKILDQKIINSDSSYYGYELIYWFYNKYNYRYSEFKPYIEDNGKCRFNESCKYFINADFKDGKFINVRIKADRRITNVQC